jgi:hypothetical protein
VRDVQTIQKNLIINFFKSRYERVMYYWLHLTFVRIGKISESDSGIQLSSLTIILFDNF